MQRRSVIRADDVASELTRVVAEPDTFLRLFRQAMAHPDLVVLSREGHDGEGSVYTTRTQLKQELATIDLGTRLALEDAPDVAPAISTDTAVDQEDRSDLNAEQVAALDHGLGAGRLRIIRGEAGTGKTRIAARLAAIHERHGWQVIGVSPTGAGLDALRDEGAASTAGRASTAGAASTAVLAGARTLKQFSREVSEGRIQLDPGTLVVLDDAGRLGAREAGQLLEDIEASGAKLVALMDDGIQTPLEAGPVLQSIEKRVGSARMETMHGRSKDRARALRQVAAGDMDGIRTLQGQGVIHAGGGLKATAAAVAERYVAGLKADEKLPDIGNAGVDQDGDKFRSHIALAWSRSEVDMLTVAIRRRLDEVDPHRARFEPETEGSFAGLKPGDRIRFVASTPWSEERPPVDAPPRIRAGETAEFLGRDEHGHMHLLIDGRSGMRGVVFTAEAEMPEWHYAFANTIHGAMGRTHDSVHLLASRGMNRQVLASALNLHKEDLTKASEAPPYHEGRQSRPEASEAPPYLARQEDLTVTVPCAEKRLSKVMETILRRDASARSVVDYGFDPSLGAREALRGHVHEEAADTTVRAVERLRVIAGLEARSERSAMPGGLGSEVLAEVIGALILHEGRAPRGEERLAVERVVTDMSDHRAWGRIRGQVPTGLPAEADTLAREHAGEDGEGRLLTTARILARGALVARATGEERLATLFERGLVLYGKRADAARLLGRPEDLVPPRDRADPAMARSTGSRCWPQPG